MYTVRPLLILLNSCLSSGNFQDDMWVGGSLPLPIIHLYAQLNVLKSKFGQIIAKLTIMVNNAGSKNKCGWLMKTYNYQIVAL